MTSKKRLFESKKRYRLRQQHNERCRRYYQRHLSKKAKEKRLKAQEKRERTTKQEELIRKVVEAVLSQKDSKKDGDVREGML